MSKRLTYNDLIELGVPTEFAEATCFTGNYHCNFDLNDDGTITASDFYDTFTINSIEEFLIIASKLEESIEE